MNQRNFSTVQSKIIIKFMNFVIGDWFRLYFITVADRTCDS